MDERSSLRLLVQTIAGWCSDAPCSSHPRTGLIHLYDRILRALHWVDLPGRSTIARVMVHGCADPFFIRLGSSDFIALREIHCDGEYRPLLTESLAPVRTIVDLGANAGYSLRFWKQCFRDSALIAVEPDAENVAMCRRNLAIVEPTLQHTTIVQGCIDAAAGEVYLDRSVDAWSYRMSRHPQDRSDPVAAVTMPQVLEQAGDPEVVDLLKCDIEGAEQTLFEDCGAWIHRIRAMVVELHRGVYSLDQFQTALRRHGWHPRRMNVLSDVWHTVVFAQR